MAGRPAGIPPIPRSPPNPAAGEALRDHRPTIVYLRRRRKGEGAVPARERGRALSGLVRERWAERSRRCACAVRLLRPPAPTTQIGRSPRLTSLGSQGPANPGSSWSEPGLRPQPLLRPSKAALPSPSAGAGLRTGRFVFPLRWASSPSQLIGESRALEQFGLSPCCSVPEIVTQPTDLGVPPLALRGKPCTLGPPTNLGESPSSP